MTRFASRAALALLGTLTVTSAALGQAPAEAPPPTGPAQIFERARDGRDKAALERAKEAGDTAAEAAPPAPPAPAPGEAKPAEAEDAQGESMPAGHPPVEGHPALQDPSQPSATPAPELAAGTIDIEVVAPTGRPFAGAEIVLGIMGGEGGRSEQRAKADAAGHYRFDKLPTGSVQAYRVNVAYNGAKFSSTPFRLPDDTGYRVRIPVGATTANARMVFQLLGQTVVELRDDRLHITQQARITNAGDSVYVTPKDGLLWKLPEGFTAFQWQDQMTDQKAAEEPGQGFRLRGSFPPGSVTLAWVFDLPRSGDSARIPVALPFKTYTYRVISEAPQGLELSATDFPEAERVKDQGRDLLFTQVRRSPNDAELAGFSIKLHGIPTPGPGRWIAVVLAAIAAGFGLVRAFSPVGVTEGGRALITQRKQTLLGLAKQTEQELARGDIGPEYHARRMDEITTELAMVLRDEEALGSR